jgi:hypothetical protein
MEPPDKISNDIGIFKIIHSRLQPTKVFKKEIILDNRISIVKLQPEPSYWIPHQQLPHCWIGPDLSEIE